MALTSRRMGIVNALVEKFKEIDGQNDFNTDIYKNVSNRLKFWDEVNSYPAVHVTPGREARVYQGGGYKDRYLDVTVRCYVKSENALEALESLLADLEFVIDQNGRLAYQGPSGSNDTTRDILIVGIDTDEGILNPIGVGEITLRVNY